MIKVTVMDEPGVPARLPETIGPITVAEIAGGDLQEGQDLDFKREVHVDKPEAKARLLDDVVAFLNRGPARLVIGVEEKGGRFDSFRPQQGDADKAALRLQTIIQDGVSPIPVDVQVVTLHLEGGFILDIQIPRHTGGPFMNRLTGSYLIRSGARNLPIEPAMLRSRFVDEASLLTRLADLAAAEDTALAASGKVETRQALRIAILPAEHFDHRRAAFAQDGPVRHPGPVFHEHSDPWFKVAEDGHEVFARDLRSRGIERLFVRDDWFVHAHAAFAIQQLSGEGRLGLGEFEEGTRHYLDALADFFKQQGLMGPFAITLSLQGLAGDDHFHAWFRQLSSIRMLRPRLVGAINDPEFLADFLRRVRRASLYG
jgi:hypothetical protein